MRAETRLATARPFIWGYVKNVDIIKSSVPQIYYRRGNKRRAPWSSARTGAAGCRRGRGASRQSSAPPARSTAWSPASWSTCRCGTDGSIHLSSCWSIELTLWALVELLNQLLSSCWIIESTLYLLLNYWINTQALLASLNQHFCCCWSIESTLEPFLHHRINTWALVEQLNQQLSFYESIESTFVLFLHHLINTWSFVEQLNQHLCGCCIIESTSFHFNTTSLFR